MTSTNSDQRSHCYQCNRPKKSCLCAYIHPIETQTKFVILIHPKEYRHIKNNTGRLTKLSLSNAELYVGVDFSDHQKVNALINDPDNFCTILYPGEKSISIDKETLPLNGKRLVVFIIDATWDSSKPMLRLSHNLHALQRISFTHTKTSGYGFKRQPFPEALSTMESTAIMLSILNETEIETIESEKLANFLTPFEKMIEYQTVFTSKAPRSRRYRG